MTFIYNDKELTFEELIKIMKKKRYGKKIKVNFPYKSLSFKINGVLYHSKYIEKIITKTIPLRPKLNNRSLPICPICGSDIYQVGHYCSACGQHLDWSD